MTVGQCSARKFDGTRECRIQVKVGAEINVIYWRRATGPRPATGRSPSPGVFLVPLELLNICENQSN